MIVVSNKDGGIFIEIPLGTIEEVLAEAQRIANVWDCLISVYNADTDECVLVSPTLTPNS